MLTLQDLWVRYIGVGGLGDLFDIDAHLKGVHALSATERDSLACALNERLDELADAGQIPYLNGSFRRPDLERLQRAIADLLDGRGDGESGATPPPLL